jgi:HNH endonuclease
MAISDKTRKLLWARSGARCAYCRKELFLAVPKDNDAIVGDECHIHARQEGGPRRNLSMSIDELDDYENLILLCKVHHKMVDDQPNSYSVNALKNLKKKHEKWVQKTLHDAATSAKPQAPEFLSRITTGKELFSVIAGAHFSDFDYDEPANKDELEFLSGFMQNLQDWGDLGGDMEYGERVEAGYNLSQDLQTLEEKGFVIFGKRETKKLKISGVEDYWEIAIIRILRNTNPTIIKIDLSQLSNESKNSET